MKLRRLKKMAAVVAVAVETDWRMTISRWRVLAVRRTKVLVVIFYILIINEMLDVKVDS